LPLLLVPQRPDHAGHAARVLAAGAGEVLTRDEASPKALRAEVDRLLAGPQRAAAAAIAAEMAEQPSAPRVIETLIEEIRR
jgi:UDP:flavonoid glycosyltransferase YjiC (YdhE family)